MKYLSNYVEAAQTELLNQLGAFFAFSKQQFEEQKKDGVQYVSMGAGLICPTDNAQNLYEGLGKIHTAGIAADIAENGIQAIIKRELYNHEAFYVNRLDDTIAALEGYNVTREQVAKVYSEEYDNAMANA